MLIDRIRQSLGDDGPVVLASALRCSPARFQYQAPRGVLYAVLELLEAATAHGIAAQRLPTRWQIDGTAIRATGPEIRQRFVRLFGADSIVARLAFAIGFSLKGLRAVLASDSGRGVDDLQAIVELLELLDGNSIPRAAWPARWRMVNKLSISNRVEKSPAPNGRDIETRVACAIGGRFPSARFARALDRTPDSLSRVWRGERDSHGRAATVQTEIVAIVELLEVLEAEGVPLERWPERWRTAVSGAGMVKC